MYLYYLRIYRCEADELGRVVGLESGKFSQPRLVMDIKFLFIKYVKCSIFLSGTVVHISYIGYFIHQYA